MASPLALPADLRIALVLGGGNALGAYHAGLYAAFEAAGLPLHHIAGTSVGALTGALIAGTPPDRRVPLLRELWRPAEDGDWPMPWDFVPEDWRRTGAVIGTMLAGRPGIFGPLGSHALAHLGSSTAGSHAIYETETLEHTIARVIDFDRLNRAEPRLTIAAIDIESGEEVLFDTARQRLTPTHIRASAALLTTFPAVEVEGRLLADGGLSQNLPLDPVLAEADDAPLLVIASDLLPLAGSRPTGLGPVIARMQDLTFAAQSRRTVEKWRTIFTLRPPRSVTLVSHAYTAQAREVAGKAMDFSRRTVRERWDAGRVDGETMLERLRTGEIALDRPGFHTY